MIDTKVRERDLEFPLTDDLLLDQLPEPQKLTPDQTAALAEAQERDRQRRLDWDRTVQALNDNSLAVFRTMRKFRHETEEAQVERVLTSYEDGSFLIDRLGACMVVDQDLAVLTCGKASFRWRSAVVVSCARR